MASTDLRLTGQTPTNNKIFTFSAWVKKGASGYQTIMSWENNSSSSQTFRINTKNDDVLQILDYSGGVVMDYTTTQVFRDTSAWYHIVVAVDTTNATANDRTKLWVNGERVTSFGTQTTYSLNASTQAQQSNYFCAIGSVNSLYYWNGSMAHVHFIDGTAYDADTFGETDATTGIWKPKTAPSVTYGTNGFFLKFENSGAFGTDSSGNGNNFTVNGTMTQTIDTPDNVFATWNPLAGFALPNGGFSNGNTTATQGGNTSWTGAISNLGVNSGKYYCEIKWTTTGQYSLFGFIPSSEIDHLGALGQTGNTHYGLYYSGDLFVLENGSTSSVSSFSSAISSGDIVQLALDKDNNKMYWGINGTWQNSANPSAGTGGYSIGYLTDEYWHFAINQRTDSGNGTMQINFGNGFFGTTAVSSAQNPDDGIGIFEYSPPTGYKALCTKSINSQEYD